MKLKSSEALLRGPLRSIPASPTTAAAASAMALASAGSFTTGANRKRKSTAAVAPKAGAMPVARPLHATSIRLMVSRLNVRAVPASVAV